MVRERREEKYVLSAPVVVVAAAAVALVDVLLSPRMIRSKNTKIYLKSGLEHKINIICSHIRPKLSF